MSRNQTMAASDEAYVRYTLDFFRRWLPYYDLFAAPIGFAYRALVQAVEPRAGLWVLDVCTGTGEVAIRCAERGAIVTGVDLSPDMLGRAERKVRRRGLAIELHEGDARRLPMADSSMDVVTISFALHDMPRSVRLEVLREAARVAKQRLLILDYDLPSSPIGYRMALAGIGLFESAYFKGFARERPAALLRDAGLDAVRRRLPGGVFSIFEVEPEGNR